MDAQSLAIMVARSENLPTLPRIVSEVLKLADDANSNFGAIEALVSKEPGIVGKLLCVANSAYYGQARSVTVRQALQVVGYKKIRELISTIAYQQLVAARSQSNLDRIELWRHSVAAGVAARELAASTGNYVASEEMYLAGLIHDSGLLILDRFCPPQLNMALSIVRTQQTDLLDAEELVLGFSHLVAGQILSVRWGLPATFGEAIRGHRHPDVGSPHCRAMAAISLADSIAGLAGAPNVTSSEATALNPDALRILGVEEDGLGEIVAAVKRELVESESTVGLLVAA